MPLSEMPTASAPHSRAEVVRVTMAVIFVALLMSAALVVVRPFLGPALWASMIAVSTWPLLLALQRRLWNRRSLATATMSLMLILLLLAPLGLVLSNAAAYSNRLEEWARSALAFRVDAAPPLWVENMPLVGNWAPSVWHQIARIGASEALAKLGISATEIARWLAIQVGDLGVFTLNAFVTIAIAAMMYLTGENMVAMLRRLAQRIAGAQGLALTQLAGGVVRGVALGVVGTALIQALIAGLGLALVGMPGAALLMALVFTLCIAQIGPLPVLLPAAIWLLLHAQTAGGVFLLVTTGIVWAMEPVLRPMLIRKDVQLPLPLIFIGVIGGLLAFGLIGLFTGPLVMGIAYTLVEAWMRDEKA